MRILLVEQSVTVNLSLYPVAMSKSGMIFLEETAMVMTMSMWVGILLEKRHRLGLLSPERPGPAAPQGQGRQ